MKKLQDVLQGIVIAIVVGGLLLLIVREEATPETLAIVGNWASVGSSVLTWISYASAVLAVIVFAIAIYKLHGGGGILQNYRTNIKD